MTRTAPTTRTNARTAPTTRTKTRTAPTTRTKTRTAPTTRTKTRTAAATTRTPTARLRVGVLAVQGAVSEHLDALRRAAGATGREIEAVAVRTAADLAGCAGIILPGGESTTISRLVRSAGIEGELRERGGKDLAVFGTCAGMILISATASHDVENKDIHLLGLLDADVDRNAFGRQRDSFEANLDVAGVGTVPAVFIRAPALNRVWGGTTVLAEHRGRIVAAQHGRVLATAFHPELTDDTRLHERFIALCQEVARA